MLAITFAQITQTPGVVFTHLAMSADGARIAFTSNLNPPGNTNADGSTELFLADTTTTPPTITQLTNLAFGRESVMASISASGRYVAFRSNGDLVGSGNTSHQIFRYDIDHPVGVHGFTQITSGLTFASDPSISGDGTRVAYTAFNGSAVNLFVYDTDPDDNPSTTGTSITNVTNFGSGIGGEIREPAISEDGAHIAFVSHANLVPGGNADRNYEVFLWSDATATAPRRFTQITQTGNGGAPQFNPRNGAPAVNADGTRIAFLSDRNLAGSNPGEDAEVFLFDVPSATATNVTRITAIPGSGGFHNPPRINPAGDRITFSSFNNLICNNSDGNQEIFRFDVASGMTQVTFTDRFSNQNNALPSISADGNLIAFISNANLGGGPADSSLEIYLATLTGPTADFGDAPASYGTAAASHPACGPTLGTLRDVEDAAHLSADATGDDAIGSLDDEDGVVFLTPLVASPNGPTTASVQITDQLPFTSSSSRLDAWVDFNGNGSFEEPAERIFTNQDLLFDDGINDGKKTISFTVPQDTGANVVLGATFARFRVSTIGNLAPTGFAPNGEVEDYQVTIVPDNQPPVANADSAATDEDASATINVLANDSDPNGDPLTVTAVTAPSHGATTLNANGTVTYTPDPNFHGADAFSYTISDGRGGSASASVTVTVNPVNDAPLAQDDAATTNEDKPVTISLSTNDSDVDGDTLAVTALSDPAHGTTVINEDGTVTYTPDPNFHGSDSFTYTTSDGNGGSATASVVVTVVSVNDDPVAVNDAATTNEDTPVTLHLLANDSDVDGDSLFVSANSSPQHGAVIIDNDGEAVYTPHPNFYGTDSFTYTISDGNDGSTTATVAITVVSVNDDPVALDDAASTDEDTPTTIDVLANDSDVDGDASTVTAVSTPSFGAAAINADGTVTYTPHPDFHGSDSFTYTIDDGHGGSATATVTLTVLSRLDVDFTGRVFDDRNNDGVFNGDDAGLSGILVELFRENDLTTPLATRQTTSDGTYLFDLNLGAGVYRIVAAQPVGLLDGKETAGHLGGTVNNAADSNAIQNIVVPEDLGDVLAAGYDFAELRPSRIQGLVWEDADNDGEVDFGERAIAGVAVRLTGTDDRGAAVDQVMHTTDHGIFEFLNQRPSNAAGYTLAEAQPLSYDDGLDSLGTVNGVVSGTNSVNDVFAQIVMTQPGSQAVDYNFGERTGSAVRAGQTATIGYWQNKNGQALIKSLNGGPTATQLGNWLATTLPNLYGAGAGQNNLTGKTNTQVAAFYKTLFQRTSQTAAGAGPAKVDAQLLAVAFAVYVTNCNLAGTTATPYGFTVDSVGVGAATINVANNGAAFEVPNGATVRVIDLLLTANRRSFGGRLFDLNGDGDATDALEKSYRTLANDVFTRINEDGDI